MIPEFYPKYYLYTDDEYKTIPYKVMFPHFGMCMRGENLNHAFIPVPRCGSSYLLQHMSENLGWMPYNYNFIQDGRFFAVLRDPYQRWLSGLWAIADPEEPNYENKPVNLLDKESLDKMFDDLSLQNHHTTQQYVFFRNLDISKITFFNFDSINFMQNFQHFFYNEFGIEFKAKDKWHSSDEKTLIKEIIESNTNNLNKLQKWLQPDFDFVKSVKFYEKI